MSGTALYKKNGGTNTEFVTDENNALKVIKKFGNVNSRIYKFPVMRIGITAPVAYIEVKSPEFNTKAPSTTPATPTISTNFIATVVEKTPFVALRASDAPHVATITGLEDVPSGSEQSSITIVSGKHDI